MREFSSVSVIASICLNYEIKDIPMEKLADFLTDSRLKQMHLLHYYHFKALSKKINIKKIDQGANWTYDFPK